MQKILVAVLLLLALRGAPTGETQTGPGNLGAERLADQFQGSDCSSKIAAAASGQPKGRLSEMHVANGCGNFATSPSIAPLQTLRFIQGGTYLVSSTINLPQGACLVGEPGGEGDTSQQASVVLKMAPGANLSPMIKLSGGQSCLVNIVIDGNKSENPTAGAAVLIQGGVRAQLKDVTVQNSKADGVEVISPQTRRNASAAAQFDHVMFLNNDLDGLYCENTGDVWVSNRSESENNGFGGAFGASYPVVDVAGREVTRISGPTWTTATINGVSVLAGRDISIGNSRFKIYSVQSPTQLTLTSSASKQSGVIARMGHGVEYAGCPGARYQDSDVGGNSIDGIKIYGTTILTSDGVMLTSNQIGANFEEAIEIQGWNSETNMRAAPAALIVGNFLFGGGSRTPMPNPAILIQDGAADEVVANTLQDRPPNAFTYGLEIRETVANREVRDNIVGNVFDGKFSVGAFTSNAAIPTAFNSNTEAVPNTLVSQPYLVNNDSLSWKDSAGNIQRMINLGADNNFYIKGHPSRPAIHFQPSPGHDAFLVTPTAIQMRSESFRDLPNTADGAMVYCADCTVRVPTSCLNSTNSQACSCVPNGVGAFAKRVNGSWLCN